jgi:hypothetical protein
MLIPFFFLFIPSLLHLQSSFLNKVLIGIVARRIVVGIADGYEERMTVGLTTSTLLPPRGPHHTIRRDGQTIQNAKPRDVHYFSTVNTTVVATQQPAAHSQQANISSRRWHFSTCDPIFDLY